MGFGASSTTASMAGAGVCATSSKGGTGAWSSIWGRMEKTDETTRESATTFRFEILLLLLLLFLLSSNQWRSASILDMKLNNNILTSSTSGVSSAGLGSAGVSVTTAVSVTATAVSLILMLVENNKATKRAYTMGSAGASGAGAGAGGLPRGSILDGLLR